MHQKSIEWKRASLESVVSKIETSEKENGYQMVVTYDLPGVETVFISTYTIFGNGVLKINNTLNESSYSGDIPRIGMRMQLPKQYNQLNYFGRGPWENYQDRKASAFVDLYESSISDQYVPYIRPQDNGYKTDTRWLSLTNHSNNGLLFVSEDMKGLSFSALHMENEDFDTTAGLDYSKGNQSKHTIDIKEKDLVQLNIDLGQRGLGGDDSWWAMPQEEYRFKANNSYSYSFYLIPFNNGSEQKLIEWSKIYRNLN